MDYAIPGITEEALRQYIRSRPLFSEITVYDAADPEAPGERTE